MATRVLIVRLPCHKVFPTGPLYLASALNRGTPRPELKLLDLALVPRAEQGRALHDTATGFKPDLIAWSWRDMQIFSPQDLDGGMRDAFLFFHHPSPLRKIESAFRGLWDITVFRSAISRNVDLMRRAAAWFPSAELALGGPSIRIFADQVRGRLPRRMRVFDGQGLEPFFQQLSMQAPPDLIEPDMDLAMIERAFPQWTEYRGETVGVQSKLGCPHRCLYCLYGYLEGRAVRRREPARVVQEVAAYARRWGSRRFWFTDAQLLSNRADHEHLAAVLNGILAERLRLEWSGYMRIHELEPELAALMVQAGLHDLEVSLNSGSQAVIDQLRLDFTVDGVMRGFETLKRAGYGGRVLVNLSLNAPGETRESLRETIRVVRRIKDLFGDDRVVPVVFFLAIQPHTGLESRALEDRHLRAGYNPLSVAPWNVLKLIYNPPPLGGLIGRACAVSFARGGEDVGERVLAQIESRLSRK
ncbi:MAG TPA: radical SAM protein [Spirochaetia bacterium]|nr:radical SAM protein [Spirochaetia bacterium]